ncbi:MAG: leucine-rich repeat protein, partial [Paludibacteraceae bacterium]|nr:leucine-rich repeat protein [Paludibacteraceae bacterium]
MKNFTQINRALVAKKKVLTFLLALVVGAGTVFAQSGTCGKDGDNLTWTLSGGTLTISGTGEMDEWILQYPSWYPYVSSIKSVVIESGVTTIGAFAFAGCSALASVVIPNTVINIFDGV